MNSEQTLFNRKSGFTMMDNCILRNPLISRNARLVYGILVSYSFGNDKCFPGHERLAAEMGISISHVRNALRELKGWKLISWTQRGLNKSNIYYIEEVPQHIKTTYFEMEANLIAKANNPEEYEIVKQANKEQFVTLQKTMEKRGRKVKKG